MDLDANSHCAVFVRGVLSQPC